jgi:GxxExxY protein
MGKYSHLGENELATKVINLAFDVHSQLGSGLLENAYKQALYFKLQKEGFIVEVEKEMPVIIDDFKLDIGYRIDILVENKLVLELKSVERLTDIHLAQTINYLKLGNFKLGLILNFNTLRLKNGIKRVANGIIG